MSRKDSDSNKLVYNHLIQIDPHTPDERNELANLEVTDEETYLYLITQIIKISIPLVLTFISLALLATFMFYLLSDQPLQMTEGFSLALLYFNCFIIGIFWGSSFGFQILGGFAYGKDKKAKLNQYLHQSVVCTFVFSIVIALLSVYVVPSVLSLLNPDPIALAYFSQLMKTFAISIPIFALFQSLLRLANIFQNTAICFFSTFMGCVVHGIVAYILFRYCHLGIDSIGIGYISNFLYCFVFFVAYYYYNNPQNILTKFTFENIHIRGILKQLSYAAFPMLNYMMFLMSCEFVSFFGFMIDDLHFTVLTVYMNILSVIIVISEAISAGMSTMLSNCLGKEKYHLPYKIFFSAFALSVVVQILTIGGILCYSEKVITIFSQHPGFIKIGLKYINIFCIVISLNSFHFVFCEFILIYGNHSLPFYSLLIGKYIIQFGGMFILTPIYGFMGIIISMIIGQSACIVIFIYYMKYNVDFSVKQEEFDLCTTSKLGEPLLDEDLNKDKAQNI